MIEVEADLGLVQEHADEPFVLRQVRKNALDRDELLEALNAGGVGLEDLGHPARADAFDDLVFLLGHKSDGRHAPKTVGHDSTVSLPPRRSGSVPARAWRWLRQNLFSTPLNSALTLLILYGGFVGWIFAGPA